MAHAVGRSKRHRTKHLAFCECFRATVTSIWYVFIFLYLFNERQIESDASGFTISIVDTYYL